MSLMGHEGSGGHGFTRRHEDTETHGGVPPFRSASEGGPPAVRPATGDEWHGDHKHIRSARVLVIPVPLGPSPRNARAHLDDLGLELPSVRLCGSAAPCRSVPSVSSVFSIHEGGHR
jgi:hypothetical protein